MTNLLPLLLQIHLQLFFRYFDQAAIGELETANKVFGLSISTDGEGASVRMWHRQPPPQPHPRGRGRGRRGQEHPQLTLEELNRFSTVGVDPNVGIFIAAVNGRDTRRGRRARTFQFSTTELYHRVGHLNNRARHTERLQTERAAAVARNQEPFEEWQSRIPTAATTQVEQLQDRVTHVTDGLDRALGFYAAPQVGWSSASVLAGWLLCFCCWLSPPPAASAAYWY